jgi:signal transduction histidine kinase
VSIRLRTTLIAGLVFGVSLFVAAYLLLAALSHELTANADAVSRSQVELLAQAAAEGNLPRVLEVPDDATAQVVREGAVIASAESLSGVGPISSRKPGTKPELWQLRNVPDDQDRESYRVYAVQVRTDAGSVVAMYGVSPERISEATRALTQLLLIGGPAMLVFSVFATYWLVGRALQPVEQIRAEVSSINDRNDLSRRVTTGFARDEVGQLAETMNSMLARLQSAVTREQEFVADASHELRSPIARLRAELESYQRESGNDAEIVRLMQLSVGELEHLVSDLLFLDQQPGATHRRQPLDLDEIVLEETQRVASSVEITTNGVSAGPVIGDPERLRRLVRNLLENAVRHAIKRVEVSLLVAEPWVLFTISDDGPGLDPTLREKVFERFFRADDSRARSSGGTGLGLAIARSIAREHGGDIELGGDHGLVATVRLPT